MTLTVPSLKEKGKPGLTLLGDERVEGIAYFNETNLKPDETIALDEYNGKI
jgi:hypothetical protein